MAWCMFWERDRGLDVDDAVRATVIYADLFDFALDLGEIDRDLVLADARPNETAAALRRNVVDGRLVADSQFITLPGRSPLVELRRQTIRRAAELWPRARYYGRILGAIPFVRMVGVTGSLAANNPGVAADVDYALVVAANRLWLARAGAIAVVRVARRVGVTLCPNYLLSTSALELDRRDLYTAHELLQLVPIVGPTTYRALIDANRWAARYLPHRARALVLPPGDSLSQRTVRRCGETALRGRLGERLECWEWRRKADRLARAGGRARFTRDICEGHFGLHREALLLRFQRQCESFGIARVSASVG